MEDLVLTRLMDMFVAVRLHTQGHSVKLVSLSDSVEKCTVKGLPDRKISYFHVLKYVLKSYTTSSFKRCNF